MATHPVLTTTALAVAVLVAAMVVGSVTCAGCQNNGRKRTLLTYNTGLTTVLADYKERRPAVIAGLKSQAHEADVMCLQEIWFEKDVKAVLDELGVEFPYHYSAMHHDVGQLRDSPTNERFWQPAGQDTSPCSLWELFRFFVCFGLYCRSSDNLHLCVLQKCESSLYALSQDCRSCVSVSSTGPADVFRKCANVFQEFNRINRPGLLLLSKQPVRNVQYVNYHEDYKVLLERGYIQAQVADGLIYVCTHLTAVFPQYFEIGLTKFKSFLEMQQAEILQLNGTFFNTPHVLLGDFNTGPARNETGFPKLDAEAPTNYALLTHHLHYLSPYMQNDGRCTYCPSENPVLRADATPHGGDIVIDHVMPSSRVRADVPSAKRVLHWPNIPASDHYGVQVDVCRP